MHLASPSSPFGDQNMCTFLQEAFANATAQTPGQVLVSVNLPFLTVMWL